MTIQHDIPLAPLTTFRVGGRASFFCEIKYPTDLAEAARFLKGESAKRAARGGAPLPFFILGEGSNTLASDAGFDGLVIKMSLRGIKTRETEWNAVELIAMAGEPWDSLVAFAVERGWYGIEALSGIPGTVGAAPVQNIGAYGTEIGEVVSFVEAYDIETGLTRTFSKGECAFAYRDSIFKRPASRRLIITRIGLALATQGRVNIGYKDLKERFKDRYSKDVTLAELRAAVLDTRARKLPDVKKVGTAGSFFKNPIIAAARYEALKAKWPDMPGFKEHAPASEAAKAGKGDERVKVPLAWILDKVCGLNGWISADGKVGCYPTQPIALVNNGGATEADIRAAALHIAGLVREKTGIDIEWEVQRLE